ncbi:MAG TPA: hypothetical protein VHH34_10495, partial [Pseudonocardiaceae bacterium]|nr:hypothetical protein [Pseudonocardiaceae bacterium]
MSGPGHTIENQLRGPDTPWLLLVLGTVWSAVLVLVVLWGFTAWLRRRKAGAASVPRRRATRRPRHAATGRAAGPAVSVREIAQRLDREAAARARRPPRRVAVIHRKAPPRAPRGWPPRRPGSSSAAGTRGTRRRGR